MQYNYANEIKQLVDMRQLLEKYAMVPNRNGFICCPFHQEKTPSLKIYSNGTRWKCFGCGEGGGVIDFVMMYFNLDFKQSITKINYDFALNLPIGKRLSLREEHEIRQLERERKKASEKAKQMHEKVFNEWLDTTGQWLKLERYRQEFMPKADSEEWDERFAESLQDMTYLEYKLDNMVVRKWQIT